MAAPGERAHRDADPPYHVDRPGLGGHSSPVSSAAREFVIPSVPEELSDVVNDVLKRADESDLDAVAEVIDQRRQELQENALVAATVGATVIVGDVFPPYLTGLSGVVKAITPGGVRYVTLTLDPASTSRLAASARTYAHLAGRDSYDLPGVPLSICRVTNT